MISRIQPGDVVLLHDPQAAGWRRRSRKQERVSFGGATWDMNRATSGRIKHGRSCGTTSAPARHTYFLCPPTCLRGWKTRWYGSFRLPLTPSRRKIRRSIGSGAAVPATNRTPRGHGRRYSRCLHAARWYGGSRRAQGFDRVGRGTTTRFRSSLGRPSVSLGPAERHGWGHGRLRRVSPDASMQCWPWSGHLPME